MTITYAQKAGFLYIAETRDPNFSSTYLGDAGIMIISRFEIKKSHFIQFSFGIHNDGWTRRGVLYAEIVIGGKEIEVIGGGSKISDSATLHLFTTHMQSSYFHPPQVAPMILKEAIACRTEQARELSSFINEKLKENMKSPHDLVLITGDFNICSQEMNPYITKKFVKENPEFAPVLKDLFLEYRIVTKLLSC